MTGSRPDLLARLQKASDRRQLVRIERSLEPGGMDGFAMSVTDDLLMLALIHDRVTMNGFTVVRVEDVTRAKCPAPYASFPKKVLRLRGEAIPEPPGVDLRDLARLLRTAGRLFPLITIHYEKEDPDVCFIGRVLSVARGKITLREIDPNARWSSKEKAERFSLNQLTRVDFGGLYEEALHLVGGDPP